MTQATCTLGGCANKHRARGYCSTHYNKLVLGERRRHPRTTRECVVCTTLVTRRKDNAHAPTCSVACRRIVQWGEVLAPRNSSDWSVDAVKRARKAGATIVETFDRESIFDRDGWLCQSCDAPCAQPNPYRLDAATVDHVVALANGGEHSRANAQTLCLSCNSSKRSDMWVAA